MPTFSIIVPVYNAEKTLRRCLDSLLAQSFQDFEVLMVENGSKDGSNAICREYAANDPRFVLYASRENRGPSGARNSGLDHAKGTYTAFLDSDDFVEPNYLEVLHEAFTQADVVFFGYHQICVDGTFLGDHVPHIAENTGYYETLIALQKQDLFGYTWIKAFRSDVIGVCRFSEALNLMEDEVFACEVLTTPSRIAVVSKPILSYVTGNAGSLIGRTHPDYCRKVDAAYSAWKTLLQPYEKKEEILSQMAQANVSRCKYYGFERDVDVKMFFAQLAETAFFADAAHNCAFSKAVEEQSGKKLLCMRTAYRLKNKIAKLLKR